MKEKNGNDDGDDGDDGDDDDDDDDGDDGDDDGGGDQFVKGVAAWTLTT